MHRPVPPTDATTPAPLERRLHGQRSGLRSSAAVLAAALAALVAGFTLMVAPALPAAGSTVQGSSGWSNAMAVDTNGHGSYSVLRLTLARMIHRETNQR
jgi:hypothetical protein